jgi:hypothetical protein
VQRSAARGVGNYGVAPQDNYTAQLSFEKIIHATVHGAGCGSLIRRCEREADQRAGLRKEKHASVSPYFARLYIHTDIQLVYPCHFTRKNCDPNITKQIDSIFSRVFSGWFTRVPCHPTYSLGARGLSMHRENQVFLRHATYPSVRSGDTSP